MKPKQKKKDVECCFHMPPKRYREQYDGWVDAYYNERQEKDREEFNSELIRHMSIAFALSLTTLLLIQGADWSAWWAVVMLVIAYIYKGMY